MLAAFGIVLFHSGAPGAVVGHAALPFFLILLIVLTAPAAARGNFGGFAMNRTRRLLLPWVLWSAIYGALKLADATFGGSSLADEFKPYMVWTGPAIHLWFLPFAFLVAIFSFGALGLAQRNIPIGSAILAAATLISVLLVEGEDLPIPLAQYSHVLPVLWLGLLMALQPGPGLAAGLGLATGLLAAGLALVLADTDQALQLGLASTAAALCLWVHLPASPITDRIGALSLTVYLAHPLVMSLLVRVAGMTESTMFLALASFGGSTLIALILSSLSLRQTTGFVR